MATCTPTLTRTSYIYLVNFDTATSLVPTQKRERAWYAISRERREIAYQTLSLLCVTLKTLEWPGDEAICNSMSTAGGQPL